MLSDADHCRIRAEQCRRLAGDALSPATRVLPRASVSSDKGSVWSRSCETLKSRALLCSIVGCDETIPEAGPISGFTYQALGCALARPATRPMHDSPQRVR
jgi:hypothetical protein